MFKTWNLFEKILLVVNILVGFLFLYNDDMSSVIVWLGFIASVTNTLCVILVAKKEISNYFWGIIGTISYGIVAYYYTNTGEWMLNFLYYMPMNIVGWLIWYKNSTDKLTIEPKKLPVKYAIVIYSLTVLFVYLYALFISHPTVLGFLYGEGLAPFYGDSINFTFDKYLIDSTSTILSIVAMILMVQCYIEQWILWIIVNIVSIILWIYTFDLMMILLWTTLLMNAIYGYYNWNGSLRPFERNKSISLSEK